MRQVGGRCRACGGAVHGITGVRKDRRSEAVESDEKQRKALSAAGSRATAAAGWD
ncbi:hypothetical protein X805_09760 [Sphaerotilus natans subsp. natans DSM 6575]|uniref:Uncharacterized protein n=1 Tax=Sphaerotilus natans subsp. natans DSM 6575 TaxID=1286631 RepID=A0A059KPM3_9BURK|nr:hypothetical protein X805_09760 [Sphaerotilus natans subsp. natans DSM 6575]